jgi:3-hydroxyisobutyrate dehydrogenase-like beta-hydroxyacid dehydrogenase
MTGGSEDALERVRPILDAFSAKIFHMGASGSGHVAKLLNNFLNGVSLSATAEVMVAAKKAGLELHTFLDVLNASSGVNFATLNRFPKIVDGDYLEGGLSSDLMMKDLLLYMDFVHSIGTPSINAAGSVASFGVAARLGYGDQISNRVVDALGDLAGGIRLHDPTTPQD